MQPNHWILFTVLFLWISLGVNLMTFERQPDVNDEMLSNLLQRKADFKHLEAHGNDINKDYVGSLSEYITQLLNRPSQKRNADVIRGDLNAAVEKRRNMSERTLRVAKRCFAQARAKHNNSDRVYAEFRSCVERMASPQPRGRPEVKQRRPKFHPKAW